MLTAVLFTQIQNQNYPKERTTGYLNNVNHNTEHKLLKMKTAL